MLSIFSLMLSKRKIKKGVPRPLLGRCMVSCNTQKVLRTFKIQFRMVSCIRSKGRKPHPRWLITSCSRLARAPREHTASPFLCVRMTRIQRGQDVHQRWTVQPPHALCRAELAEPLSADSAQTKPLRSDQR